MTKTNGSKARKIGRPALPKGERRDTWIKLRVRPDEAAAWTAIADAHGIPLAELIRRRMKGARS